MAYLRAREARRLRLAGMRRALLHNVLTAGVAALEAGLHIVASLIPGDPLRAQRLRWNASEDEATRPLPGDELIPSSHWSYTHGITVDAPASAVWP